MWRTFGLIVLFGLLVVPVLFLRATPASSAEADHLRQPALTAEQQQHALQQQATPAAPAPATATASPTLLSIEQQVAALRGLQPKQDVPLEFLNQDALHQFLVDNFNRDYLPSERDADQKLDMMLGLLGPNDNLVQILLQVLQEQVIGIYSVDDKTMYLVGDPANIDADEQSTFAHEFTHALQDQYFDLNAISPKHPSNDDQAAAVQALIEGDAVLTQRLWSQAHLTADERSAIGQAAPDTSLLSAPPIVREQLLFPYTDGFAFVQQAYQAQHDPAAVDSLFRNPPASTAQILHPDRYAAGVQPVEVTLPDLAAAMGDGWRELRSSVLGELELEVATEQFTDHVRAVQATSGWAGDRWSLLEKDGRDALVIQTTWDSDTSAEAFFDTYGLALTNRFGGARQEAMTDSRQALTAATAATELRLSGRNVLVAIAFDRPTVEALATAAGG